MPRLDRIPKNVRAHVHAPVSGDSAKPQRCEDTSGTSPAGSPRVLVLDGHCRAAAAAVQALATSCRVDVACTHLDGLAQASRRVERRLLQPAGVGALVAWVKARHAEAGYDLIVPTTEASLLGLKSRSLDPGLRERLVLPPEASIDIALDKHRTWALARELGLPAPDGVRVDRAEEIAPARGWPCVIKPLNSKVATAAGTRSLQVRICRDEAERQAAYRDLLPHTPVLEQVYFRGRGIGVELLFEHGRPRWTFAHERIHELPVTGGGSTYRRAITAPAALEAAALAMLVRLQWHGVAMVEFKLAADGAFTVVEINPRLWGSLPLAIAAGVDFPRGLLRLAMGQDPGPQPDYRRDFYARNLGADLRWFAKSLRHSHPLAVKRLAAADALALLRPLTGHEHWDLFRWSEPQLWWAMTRQALLPAAPRRVRVN